LFRISLVCTTFIASCLMTSQADAAWRRAWRGRSVQKVVPATQKVYTQSNRAALPRSEFRGYGFGGYGYGSGYGPDFRPGRW